MNTKDNWIKAFDNHFKELGFHNLPLHQDIRDEVKSFISQVEKNAIEKTNKRWENLKDYCVHQDDCILSYFSGGRPTDDGGYECKYGEKWYQTRPIDKTPKCNCGLSDLLEDKK